MIKSMPLSLIERYQNFLPLKDLSALVSLGEGNTPLIRLTRGLPSSFRCFVKCEGMNPTGSFKDRGMTMAISKAKEAKSTAVLCASTGNTSASAAAYAARAGMQSFVIIPEGQIAMGKLAQALIHGAQVIQIEGNFDDGMHMVQEIVKQLPLTLVNSVNPYRLEGQKTAAFEIMDALERAPDYHYLPVGNAGNISAYWKGYSEYYQLGIVKNRPVMVGAQAAGANPFIQGKPVLKPETLATAIRIGNPMSWELANKAQVESGGWFEDFSDEVILKAQRWLALQGIFCEPASAASVAAMLHDLENSRLPESSLVVCTLTGHGLKDPAIAIENFSEAISRLPSDFARVKSFLEEKVVA